MQTGHLRSTISCSCCYFCSVLSLPLIVVQIYLLIIVYFKEFIVKDFLKSSGVTPVYFLKNFAKYELSVKLSLLAISEILIPAFTRSLLASSNILSRIISPEDLPNKSVHTALRWLGVIYSIAA